MSVEALSWAFQQPVTPAAKKLVLLALANRADENGCCYPGYKKLAAQCSMGRSTVIRHVKDLEREGLLQKISQTRTDGTDTSNLYRLTLGGGSQTGTLGYQTGTGRVSDRDPNYTNSLKKEKKALARPDFLREIDQARLDGAFAEWPHLTETEIVQAADACFDHWAAKAEWPGGDPRAVLRNWIRNGVSRGKIRKAEKPKEGIASGGSKPQEPEREITLTAAEGALWRNCQVTMKQRMGDAVFNSWLSGLMFGGIDQDHTATLYVKTNHAREWIARHYAARIEDILTEEFGCPVTVCIVHAAAVYVVHNEATKEKELCTA